MRQLAKKILGKSGIHITRTLKKRAATKNLINEKLIQLLAESPLNKDLHLKCAEYAEKSGKRHLAFAEYKTAEFLGAKLNENVNALRPDPINMEHNKYFRLYSLASEIVKKAGHSDISILDVGGGQGFLASFIPDDASYFLAEPRVNGISGKILPFPDHSFDYVVSCHVLEHVPINERSTFLTNLLQKAKFGIFLLNPFYVEKTRVEDRLKLFVKITGYKWAEEHLECTLPKIEDIKDYATKNGLEIYIRPNGTMTTSMAFVFLNYFSGRSGLRDQWREVNKFYNENYTEILDSDKYPNAYIVYLGWPKSTENSRTK